ncbi:MAG: hypothetical protein RLZZ522_267, partial [Verrucomicrobiota bacterium]
STLNTVQVVDTFNATQLAYVSASPAANSSAVGSRTWTNVGPLSSGQSVDIIVDFNGLAATNPSINTVNVTTGSGGPTASDTEPVIITRPAVTVIKTLVSPNPGPANKGDDVVFNISVQNTGTTALATVPLEDTFSDADFEFVSSSVAPDGIGAGSLLWNDVSGAGDLAVNDTFNVSVTLKVNGAANPATNLAVVNYAVDTFGDPVPPSGSSAGLQTMAATISGKVFEDRGVAGFGGDVALPNVTVKLYSDPNGDGDPSDGTVLAVTTSDTTGYYEFLNLGVAHYVVVQEDQLGYSSVTDTAAANDNRIPVDVITLTSYPNNNFLDRLVDPATYGSISGQVRNDTNANGNLADSESGLAGAILTLFTDPNGDGNPDDGIAFGVPVTTTASGAYSFANLPPGTYVVVETDPAGFVSTADVVNPNNNQIPVNLAPSAAVTGRDFLDTNNTAALGVIGNQVWLDTNNDGLFGGGESGVNGVVVQLYLSSQTPGVDSPYLTTTTSGGGLYQFSNVPAGNYVVYLPAGNFVSGGALASAPLSSTITVAIDNTTDNDDNGIQTSTGAAVISPVIALTAGETDNTKDFGFVPTTSLGSITGSVRVNTSNDPIPGVTLSLLDASGSPVLDGLGAAITTITATDGTYSFADLPPGNYRVAETQPSGFYSISDKDGGNKDLIGDVTLIAVLSGQPNTDNNFIEEISTCTPTWAAWKQLNPGQQAVGNPEADAYDNLNEFSFAMSAGNGVGDTFHIQPSQITAGKIDAVFVRPTLAILNVTYYLEYASSVGTPTVWASIALTPSMYDSAPHSYCKELITIKDLESYIPNYDGKGVVRIRTELDEAPPSGIDHISHTEVEGWKETPFGICCQTFGVPYLRDTEFTGTVDAGGVSGQVVSFTLSAGTVNLSTILTPGAAYYLEVTSGSLAGQRFDIASASGATVTLAQDSDLNSHLPPFNTLTGAAPAGLAGSSVVIRRHWTVGEVFPKEAFGSSTNQALADQIQLFSGGVWTILYLYNDAGTPRWVNNTDNTIDQGGLVIAPGQGMFLNNRNGAKTLLSYGEIRRNSFVRPLATGSSLVSGGYPLTQSATGAGSREMTTAKGFIGTKDFKTADSFFVWKGDTTPGLATYDTYYLLNGAPQNAALLRWVKVGDATAASRSADLLLLENRAVFTRSSTGLPTYGYASPWTP